MFLAIMYVFHLEKRKMQKTKNHNIATEKQALDLFKLAVLSKIFHTRFIKINERFSKLAFSLTVWNLRHHKSDPFPPNIWFGCLL